MSGFITFDTQVHFYNLKSSLSVPQMLVVSDVSDVIMPLPEDLLVNLCDSKKVVMTLLDSLPSMFKTSTGGNAGSCTGSISSNLPYRRRFFTYSVSVRTGIVGSEACDATSWWQAVSVSVLVALLRFCCRIIDFTLSMR